MEKANIAVEDSLIKNVIYYAAPIFNNDNEYLLYGSLAHALGETGIKRISELTGKPASLIKKYEGMILDINGSS